jgi:hypothetical protein
MDNTRLPEKRTEWNISWRKTSGKTMVEMGTQNQYGLLVAAEYKRMEEVSRGQEHRGKLLKRLGPDVGCRAINEDEISDFKYCGSVWSAQNRCCS